MGYLQTQKPGAEPISVAEVKLHIRVDQSDEDTLMAMIITAARQHAEQITARSFMTQKWAYILDGFYDGSGQTIRLEKGPVNSVDSITYIDMAGVLQTMPPTDYAVDYTGPLTRITPKFGKIWPITLPQMATVIINFTAGYGDATQVPEGLKSWIKLRCGTLYENREDVLIGQRFTVVDLNFVDTLLDPYRILRA